MPVSSSRQIPARISSASSTIRLLMAWFSATWKRLFLTRQPFQDPANYLDHAMDSELRIDSNQDVDVVRHDLGLEPDAVRFLSNFGTDLLEPPLDAIDQHVAPIFPTKDHVVLTRKDDVALRSGRHLGIRSNGLYNHQEGRASPYG
jgi:hypothetical protein